MRCVAVVLGTSLLGGCVSPVGLASDGAVPAADAPSDRGSPVDVAQVEDAAADAPAERTTDAARPLDDAQPGSRLEIRVFRVPDNTPPGASLALAGNFNGWQPVTPLVRLAGGPWSAQIDGVAAGQRIEWKVTRGSWATVEKARDGSEIPNRVTVFDPAHPIVAAWVERWADLPAPAHTRSGDVRILPDVQIPQLGVTRNVWVYLPPDHDQSPGGGPYPVAYCFDAQNLFDVGTSAFGAEWQLDEALETLFHEGRIPGVIAVGLENSAARPCEYSVFPSDPHPGCADASALGERTLAFLAETLKPRIDGAYRTRTGRADTALIGSSMGGSMAVYGAFLRPDVYGLVAALSPSYQNQLSHPLNMPGYVRAHPPGPTRPLRVHQDMGGSEQIREIPAATLIANMQAVDAAMGEVGVASSDRRARVVAGATHDERAWSARIGEILAWLFAR